MKPKFLMRIENVPIPESRLKESRGLSPAQLSPPAGTATACCFHIASFCAVRGAVFTVVFRISCSAAPQGILP